MTPRHQQAKDQLAIMLRDGHKPTERSVSQTFGIAYVQAASVIEQAKEAHSMWMLSLFGPPSFHNQLGE